MKTSNTPCSNCGSKEVPLHTNGICGNCANPNAILFKEYLSEVALSDTDKAHLLVLSKTLSEGQLKAIVSLMEGIRQAGYESGLMGNQDSSCVDSFDRQGM